MDILKSRELLSDFMATVQPDVQRTIEDRVQAFALANEMENQVGKVRTTLRDALIPEVRGEGKEGKKGVILEVTGASATLTSRRNAPNMEAVRVLCESKGIPLDQVTETVTTIKVSPSKLEALVARGVLPKADYEALSSTTPVLSADLTE